MARSSRNPGCFALGLASVDELTHEELKGDDNRFISGSVLSGRKAMGEVFGYLGRYDLQVSYPR